MLILTTLHCFDIFLFSLVCLCLNNTAVLKVRNKIHFLILSSTWKPCHAFTLLCQHFTFVGDCGWSRKQDGVWIPDQSLVCHRWRWWEDPKRHLGWRQPTHRWDHHTHSCTALTDRSKSTRHKAIICLLFDAIMFFTVVIKYWVSAHVCFWAQSFVITCQQRFLTCNCTL